MSSAPFRETKELSTIRARLRGSTAALHARVDMSLGHILHSANDGYGHFLTGIAMVLLPLERALSEVNVSAILSDWPQRARSSALLSDLSALSLPVPRPCVLRDKDLMGLEAYQFGILYVLEGSRLGGQAILRERKKTGQVGPTNYLSHGGGQPLWPLFVAQLEASDATQRHPELALAGATDVFEMFLCAEEALQ